MPGYVLDYLELPSSNTARSRDFFGKAFGWTFVHFGDTYDEVHGAGLLAGINGDAADRSEAPIPVIRTHDIEQAERDVVAAGGVITRKPYDYPGGRRFLFREPGGAELAVYAPKD
ncbi:MAG: VOC family protein [Devosia nanyangense]|uniref:VOC family protein n=1 Tax=Devosia nanyangense TaxID=1228055 RepID=A0A933L489_9HYPH|nr:VOC family protein [Devosia nanyangense]